LNDFFRFARISYNADGDAENEAVITVEQNVRASWQPVATDAISISSESPARSPGRDSRGLVRFILVRPTYLDGTHNDTD
jgi:hypothetical protein